MPTPTPQTPQTPHPESLLQLPLVRHALSDPGFRLVERGVDPEWTYAGHLPIAITGFNPFEAAYYYGWRSSFSRFLRQPEGSARALNEGDALVREVLFMVHDYLHAWAYQLIDGLRPELGLLTAPLGEAQRDDFAIAHLITEAAAVVGLDYWFLCVRSINEHCPIGSAVGPLAVSYHERDGAEFRRFHPLLDVQCPRFFSLLGAFYCHGEFPGFDVEDLRRSPLLLRWLRHELSYGAQQRRNIRHWLAYLAGDSPQDDDRPLPLSPRHYTLMEEVGAALWALVKEGAPLHLSGATTTRRSDGHRPPDFRLVNLHRVTDIPDRADPAPFSYYMYQYLSRIPLCEVPKERLRHLPLLARERDPLLLSHLFGDLPVLPAAADEPRDLMLLN